MLRFASDTFADTIVQFARSITYSTHGKDYLDPVCGKGAFFRPAAIDKTSGKVRAHGHTYMYIHGNIHVLLIVATHNLSLVARACVRACMHECHGWRVVLRFNASDADELQHGSAQDGIQT